MLMEPPSEIGRIDKNPTVEQLVVSGNPLSGSEKDYWSVLASEPYVAHQRHRELLGLCEDEAPAVLRHFEKPFFLYLKEMEFRFNRRHENLLDLTGRIVRKYRNLLD